MKGIFLQFLQFYLKILTYIPQDTNAILFGNIEKFWLHVYSLFFFHSNLATMGSGSIQLSLQGEDW